MTAGASRSVRHGRTAERAMSVLVPRESFGAGCQVPWKPRAPIPGCDLALLRMRSP